MQRRIVSVLVVLASAFAGSACISNPSLWTASCVVVVDASGSGGGFDAAKRLDDTLVRFLTGQECGHLAFVPLNSLSESSKCKKNPIALDPEVGDPDQVRPALRAEALKRAKELLDCATTEPRGSDVLGSLRQVVKVRPAGPRTYSVLMVSDMVQNDDGVNFYKADLSTPQVRAQLINRFEPLTPDLAGAVIYPTNFSSAVADGRSATDIERFWIELFATNAAGHPSVKETYV